MNRSNFYIFMYASVMVIIVAAVLSLGATGLKPLQDKNEETLANQANTLFQAGNYVQAKDVYSQLVSLYPKNKLFYASIVHSAS